MELTRLITWTLHILWHASHSDDQWQCLFSVMNKAGIGTHVLNCGSAENPKPQKDSFMTCRCHDKVVSYSEARDKIVANWKRHQCFQYTEKPLKVKKVYLKNRREKRVEKCGSEICRHSRLIMQFTQFSCTLHGQIVYSCDINHSFSSY
jgi:hypothetical protein